MCVYLAVVSPYSTSSLVTNSHVKLSFAVVVLSRSQKTRERRLVITRFSTLQTWNTIRCSDVLISSTDGSVCAVIIITNDVEDYWYAAVRHVSQILRCFIRCETFLQETHVMMKSLTKANHVYCVFRSKFYLWFRLFRKKSFFCKKNQESRVNFQSTSHLYHRVRTDTVKWNSRTVVQILNKING